MKQPRNRLETVSKPEELPANRAEMRPEDAEETPEDAEIQTGEHEIITHPECNWCGKRNSRVIRRMHFGRRDRFCNLCKRRFTTDEKPLCRR